MANALGMDVSRYQVLFDDSGNIIAPVDFSKAKSQGIKFVAIRASVGDYYSDPAFVSSYEGAKAQDLLVTAYHVVRPDKPIKEQIDRFLSVLDGRVPLLPLVLDCEVAAGQLRDRITTVIRGCVLELMQRGFRRPLIYTRQSWFDLHVNPDPEIAKCDLWPARYIEGLDSPWGDGYYEFRDWVVWKIWQYSADENSLGAQYGVQSASVDLDWFNGTEAELMEYAGLVELPQVVRVKSVNGAVIREGAGAGKYLTVAPFGLYLHPLEEVCAADETKFYKVGEKLYIGKGLVETV